MDNRKKNNATLNESALTERIQSRITRELSFLTKKTNLSKEDVEDLSQDIFIKVWTNIDSYSSEKASLDAWVSAITRHCLCDWFRHYTSKGGTISLSTYDSYNDEEVDEEGTVRAYSVSNSDWADDDLEKEERRQAVRDVLSLMKDEDSTLLSMYLDDYDGEVMADRFGITANAVYGRIFKCKGKFKELYRKVA